MVPRGYSEGVTKPGLARVTPTSRRRLGESQRDSQRPASDARTGAEFREWVREAIHDPASALDLFVAYGRLDHEERSALREAIRGDGHAMGLDTRPLTNALEVIDRLAAPAPRSWQAYEHRGGVVIGAPGRGALAATNGRVRLHRRWSPPKTGAQLDVEEAVDHLAALLWDARQRGDRWPNRLAEFADLFDR